MARYKVRRSFWIAPRERFEAGAVVELDEKVAMPLVAMGHLARMRPAPEAATAPPPDTPEGEDRKPRRRKPAPPPAEE